MHATCQTIATREGRVEYSVRGSGLPVLFVHGGQSSCIDETLHHVLDPSKYQLITPSRPGYRRTPLDGKTQPAATADLCEALLDDLGIDTAVVVGVSCGGPPAIELAARHPYRVKALVLSSAITQPWLTPDDAVYHSSKRRFRPGAERRIWALMRLAAGLFPARMAKVMHAQLSTVRGAPLDTAEIAAVTRKLRTLRSYEGFVHDLDHRVSPGALERIKCPTLILHSENDGSVPLAHAQHAATLIPDATLITYDNTWGHFLWIGKGSDQPIHDLHAFLDAHAT